MVSQFASSVVLVHILALTSLEQIAFASDAIVKLKKGIHDAKLVIDNTPLTITYKHYEGDSENASKLVEKGHLTYQLGKNRTFCVRGRSLGLDIVKCRNESYGFYLQKPIEAAGSNYSLSWLHNVSNRDSEADRLLKQHEKNAFDAVYLNYSVAGIYIWDLLEIPDLILEHKGESPENRQYYAFQLNKGSALSKELEITHGELVFDPTCFWALAYIKVATSRIPGQYIIQEIENTAIAGGPGIVKTSLYKHYSGGRIDYCQKSVSSTYEASFDESKAYLSAYGLKEPSFGIAFGWWPWLLMTGVLLLVGSVLIRKGFSHS